MGKSSSQNPSICLDISNSSTADIVMQASGRMQCTICNVFNLSSEFVDLCRCEDPVHQTCMIQEIDQWIQTKTEIQNSQTLKDEMPFKCNQCKRNVFYRAKIEIICRKSTEMLIYMKDYPLISATQILIFLISMCSLIFGILLKLESIDLRIDLSPLTISIIAIAIIISSSLMVVIAFYFIFMGILTRRRKRVDKIYQRIKKRQRKQVQLIPVINIS